MGRLICTIVFITWTHLCWACNIVDQSPSLLVTLYDKPLKINCCVTTENVQTETIKTSVIFKDEPNTNLDEREKQVPNTTTNYITTHTIHTRQSGTYKCQVTCNKKTSQGAGTYIYVREFGYREPTSLVGGLQAGLIALLVLLLILTISGTYLVVPFRCYKERKPSKPSKPSRGVTAPSAIPPPTTLQPQDETSSSLYTSLQPHSDDVYDVLEEDIPRQTNVRHQAEVHSVPIRGPMKRSKPQARATPGPEKPPADDVLEENVPRQTNVKSKAAAADNSLYENL